MLSLIGMSGDNREGSRRDELEVQDGQGHHALSNCLYGCQKTFRVDYIQERSFIQKCGTYRTHRIHALQVYAWNKFEIMHLWVNFLPNQLGSC